MTVERIGFLGMLSSMAHVELFERVCDTYDHLNPIRSDMFVVFRTEASLLDDLDDLVLREDMTYTSISLRTTIDYRIMYQQMFGSALPERYMWAFVWPEATYSTVYVMPGHPVPAPGEYPGVKFIKLQGDIYDQLKQIIEDRGE